MTTHAQELDVRAQPRAGRHERIFAAYDELAAGEAFVLVNDHDPKHLHQQLAARHAEQLTWDYVERGPDAWRVRIGRVA